MSHSFSIFRKMSCCHQRIVPSCQKKMETECESLVNYLVLFARTRKWFPFVRNI